MVRDRLNPTERIETLFELHRKWSGLSGRPPKVGYERYGMQSDLHYIKKYQNETSYRFPLIELGGQMIKEERIRRIIPDMQHGRWYFPTDLIYTDYEGRTIDLVHELRKSEIATFPKSRYDDMLDSITRIYDENLFAIFPKIKNNSANKGRYRKKVYTSFMDF